MKKVGIVSIYYNNDNYGGALQAYALSSAIQKLGYDAEQIRFTYQRGKTEHRCVKEMSFGEVISKVASRTFGRVIKGARKKMFRFKYGKHDGKVKQAVKLRHEAFESFKQKSISQSEQIYTKETIAESLQQYNAFVTGSDQVWNPLMCHSIYLLDFVPSDRLKLSYAASVSTTELRPDQQKMFQKSLSDYAGVSVREEQTVSLLQDCGVENAVLSLDPTLLLNREDWDKIASARVVQEEYVFCYFLGEDKENRKIAKAFADKHGLKVVAIPYLMKHYNPWDDAFTDICIADIAPDQFVSLIKHAQYVFTDSFHASVFSSIYQKEFFVFNRKEHKKMNVRIYSLLNILGLEERFCDTSKKRTLSYMEQCKPMAQKEISPRFAQEKKTSLRYLSETLGGAEGERASE